MLKTITNVVGVIMALYLISLPIHFIFESLKINDQDAELVIILAIAVGFWFLIRKKEK